MTLDWLMIFARDLALAVWLGGLIVIDFVEAPAKFRVRQINRNQAVAVGRAVFVALLRVEIALGLLLVIVHLLAHSRASAEPLAARWQTSLTAVMTLFAVALLQKFSAIRRLQQASEGVDLVARTATDGVFTQMKRWHRIYVAGDLLKMAMGLFTLALWVGTR
jgi:hypothetical protein